MKYILTILTLMVAFAANAADNTAQYLQDISVTINADRAQGSGVIITRELKVKKDDETKAKVNFIWTAAHVVDHLRKVRTVVDPVSGTEKKIIEFGPVAIVKELTENGRKVGETKMEAKVVKYSDAESGNDLALLMLYKRNFVDVNTKFYLDEEIPQIGTPLFHVGSLLGQSGSNSMTTGIVSQIGRVLNFTGTQDVVFDQTTVTAFPGSSGGGVFLASDSRYVGMLVRGAGETFNLIVPARRMKEFAKKNNIEWALDEAAKIPSLEEILAQPIEQAKVQFNSNAAESKSPDSKNFPILLKIDTKIVEPYRE